MPLGVTATLTAAAGCALFDGGGWTSASPAAGSRSTLKPISEVTAGVLQLEYTLIERPAGDPLLGDQLWDELDQIGALRPDVRRKLADSGLRVGVASTRPPAALQKLLGESREIVDHRSQEEARRLNGQRLSLPPGESTEAVVSDLAEIRTLRVEVAGTLEERSFQNSRCLLRVTAATEQEGWATLEFLPEIHHGSSQLRPAADATGWKLKTGQDALRLYGQQFRLTLNEGEMAVVTLQGDAADLPGQHFFHADADGAAVQRLLVVRLIAPGTP